MMAKMTDDNPYQNISDKSLTDSNGTGKASGAKRMFWSFCVSSSVVLALSGALPLWFWTSSQPSLWLLPTSMMITLLVSPMLYVGSALIVKGRFVLLVISGYSLYIMISTILMGYLSGVFSSLYTT